ncbi:MAG: class I SAM-dependent methyltransferase, partial [bacterium]
MEAKANQAYCIKENYRPNLKPSSVNGYWNSTRVKMASAYQYHVYEKAGQLLLRYRLNSVLDVGSGPGSKIKELIWPHCRDVVLVDHPMIAPLAKQTLPMAEVVGVDLEQALVDLGKRFQLVICSDVIEHLTDPDPCVTFIR